MMNLRNVEARWDEWFGNNWPMLCAVILIGWLLALSIGAVMIVSNQARLSAQYHNLRIQQMTNAERIKSLADEQSWVRERETRK
jgi:hypothetical protein